MSKSQIIGLADVRQIFGLLGEIRERRADPAAWRLHLLSGLTALLGGTRGPYRRNGIALYPGSHEAY